MSMNFMAQTPDGIVEEGPNFSNSNALSILRWLGLEDEAAYAAENGVVRIDAEKVIAACLVAGATGGGFTDDGQESISHQWPGYATMTACGKRAGYYADACAEIHEAALAAQAAGGYVVVA